MNPDSPPALESPSTSNAEPPTTIVNSENEGEEELEGDNDPASPNRRNEIPGLKYQPLNPARKEIRLLTILDEDEDFLVRCTLSIVSLLDSPPPKYKALSYCWGDSNSSAKTVIVVDRQQVGVTRNLEGALRALRWRGEGVIWVDAICVDQGDWGERSSQVQIMQQIYSVAEMVIVWVGSAEDDTAEAVKFLLERSSSNLAPPEKKKEDVEERTNPSISPKTGHGEFAAPEESLKGGRGLRMLRKRGHLRRTSIRTLLGLLSLSPPERDTGHSSDETTSPTPSPRIQESHDNFESSTVQESPRYSRLEKAQRKWIRNQWSIIQDFFNQDYWKRVWVIQEVAVATDLKVLYGCSEISWDNVAAAIVLWKKTLMSLPTSHLSHLYAAQLLDLRNRFIEKQPISLLYAMLVTNKAMSTDPRDKLFALLGLTFDGPALVPSPNYEDSLEVILSNLIRAMIISEKSLDVLCIRSHYPPENNGLPSWISPWITNPEFSFWSNSMTILENRLISTRSNFQEIPIMPSIDQTNLTVQGVILDEIFALTSSLNHETNPLLSECTTTQCSPSNLPLITQNIANFYPSGPTNALWQTLCMEHTFHPDPLTPENQYYTARTVATYRSCFADLFTHPPSSLYHRRRTRLSPPPPSLQTWLDLNADLQIGALTLREWTINTVTKPENTESDMRDFCDTLLEILGSGMRLFVSGLGYLGMAPPGTRRGDKVGFLRGCGVPVVLREAKGRKEGMGFEVVGAAFVRVRFEGYAEACGRFARGEGGREGDPVVNVREVVLV